MTDSLQSQWKLQSAYEAGRVALIHMLWFLEIRYKGPDVSGARIWKGGKGRLLVASWLEVSRLFNDPMFIVKFRVHRVMLVMV